MMGIEDFKVTKPKPKPTVFQYKISIDVQCQQCDRWYEEAIYVPDQNVLTWKCEDCGFASVIKGFNFG